VSAAALAVGLALAAAPQRLALPPAAHASISVRNFGDRPATVELGVAAYRLDLRGRPRIGGRAAGWVGVAPRRLRIAAHGSASVDVVARAPRGAAPGDHSAVVTLTGSTVARGAQVVLRLGVVVAVRVPGRLTRRVALGGVTLGSAVERRLLTLSVRNAGNVDVWLGRRAVVVRMFGRGRLLASWLPPPRRVLAHGVTAYSWRVPSRLRAARVDVDVQVRAGSLRARRRYHLRL
jgi:hypothetical protein